MFDTAGIRESKDFVEEIGIKKSINKLNESDLVLVIFDSLVLDDEDKKILEFVQNKDHIIVYNKADLFDNNDKNKLFVSALKEDINPLKEEIVKHLGLSKNDYTNPSIANTRELGILENLKSQLIQIKIDNRNNLPVDIINSEIHDAYLKVLSLTGEDNDFDIAAEIFSRFCVGK